MNDQPPCPVYVALVHHSIRDKQGKLVNTAITNLDIHDIARAARTYGLAGYYLVNPEESQQAVAKRIMGHWGSDAGKDYNPDRAEAFSLIKICSWLNDAISDIERIRSIKPFVVMTSARRIEGTLSQSFRELRKRLTSQTEPVLLVLGTGWGLDDSFIKESDAVLEPIKAAQANDYRHLSVRSAAAILFDRLLGDHN